MNVLNICGLEVSHYFMLFSFIHFVVLCETFLKVFLGNTL